MERLTSAYMGQACWNCDKLASNVSLTPCAHCSRCYFCSTACREASAESHRLPCKAIASLAPTVRAVLSGYENSQDDSFNHVRSALTSCSVSESGKRKDWQQRVAVVRMLVRGYGEALDGEENAEHRSVVTHTFLYCAKCAVCDMVQGEEGEGAKVELACYACRACFACPEHSEEAKTIHTKKKCTTFRLLTGAQKYRRLILRKTSQSHRHFIEGAATETMPVEISEKGFDGSGSYFEWRMKEKELRDVRDWSVDTDTLAPSGISFFEVCSTASLSPSLTLAHGLVKFGLHSRKRAVVHVIGAANYEALTLPRGWEEVLHVLAPHGLLELDISFIGPDFPGILQRKNWCIPLPCPDCKTAGRRVRFRAYTGVYENFLKQGPCGETLPDLAVSFNSGLHEPGLKQLWLGAADVLLKQSVPWLLTSYTASEGADDDEALRQLGAHVTVSARKNPWNGSEPFQDLNDPNAFYYDNFYFTCVHGLEKKLSRGNF